MKCPSCNSEVSAGKFCPKCGKPLPKVKYCVRCGSEIMQNMKFCVKCGAPNSFYVKPEEPSAPNPVAEPQVLSQPKPQPITPQPSKVEPTPQAITPELPKVEEAPSPVAEPQVLSQPKPQPITPQPPRAEAEPQTITPEQPKAEADPQSVPEPQNHPATEPEALQNQEQEEYAYYDFEEPKRNLTWLWLIIALVVIGAGIAGYIYFTTNPSESKVLSTEGSYEDEPNKADTRNEDEFKADTRNEDKIAVADDDTIISIDEVIEAPAEPAETYRIGRLPLNFKPGKNSFVADMIHTNGKRYPFTLSFNLDPRSEMLTDIIYKNIGSGTTLKLQCDYYSEDGIRLSGRDGGKDFILEFHGNNPYRGDAWWGNFHQDIELTLK